MGYNLGAGETQLQEQINLAMQAQIDARDAWNHEHLHGDVGPSLELLPTVAFDLVTGNPLGVGQAVGAEADILAGSTQRPGVGNISAPVYSIATALLSHGAGALGQPAAAPLPNIPIPAPGGAPMDFAYPSLNLDPNPYSMEIPTLTDGGVGLATGDVATYGAPVPYAADFLGAGAAASNALAAPPVGPVPILGVPGSTNLYNVAPPDASPSGWSNFLSGAGNLVAAAPSFLAGIASPLAKLVSKNIPSAGSSYNAGSAAGSWLGNVGNSLGSLLGGAGSGIANLFRNGIPTPTPGQAYSAGQAVDSALGKLNLPSLFGSKTRAPAAVQTAPYNPTLPAGSVGAPAGADLSGLLPYLLIGAAVLALITLSGKKKLA